LAENTNAFRWPGVSVVKEGLLYLVIVYLVT